MHRRNLVAGLVGVAGAAVGGAPTRAQARPPSAVVIVTDDMRHDDLDAMPKTRDLLVEQGMNFSGYFSTTPTCCPARASILRGQYAHNHGVVRTEGGGYRAWVQHRLENSTLATWLKSAGYRTGMIGKFHNGYDADAHRPDRGWDRWVAADSSSFVRYRLNVNGRVVEYGPSPRQYQTDVFSRHAQAFLRDTADAQPFFLYLAPRAPHAPSTPARRHRGMFAEAAVPRTDAWNEEDVSDKPGWVSRLPRLDPRAAGRLDASYRKRLQSLQAVDDLVADLIAALEQQGRLDDTYVFLTSDNGWHGGEHRLNSGKETPYDEATRMPLVVRGPRIAAGAETKYLAMHADLAPTIADLAGVEVPAFVDGRSLVPVLHGVGGPDRDALLLEGFGRRPSRPADRPPFVAVRTPDRLYVESDAGDRELYDLEADPFAADNLLATGDEPPEAALLGERLAALRQCSGETCRMADAGV